MPPPPLLALQDAAVRFDARPVFAGISVAIGLGERICLVGRNGSGKSTLLKALAGEIDLDAGAVFRQPGVHVAYVPQTPILDPALTAGDFVTGGLRPAADEGDRAYLVAAMLDEVAVPATRTLANLSGGEARRVSLARALVGSPDILLLDEPTNHLDIAAIEWLEQRLAAERAGLLLISHDRTFLRALSRRTLWLDRGVLRETDNGYARFDEWSEAILAVEAAADARADKLIEQETKWSRAGISARRRRNQGRLRRLEGLRAARAQRVTLGEATLGAGSAEAGGRLVIELRGVAKAYDGRPIVKPFSARILRGDRVGIIGRNGAGKSTLVGLMAGTLAPDTGAVRHGTNLMPAVFDQMRAALDPDRTLWETLTGGVGDTVLVHNRPRHVTSYLRDFLFEDTQFRAKVSTLSGGERNRLLLAKVLAQPSNLLILDEPTNDLDMDTLDLLQEVLDDYEGTLLLVTHDRDFLDRLVTSTIAVEGNGVVHEYVGGYTDYLRQRRTVPAVAVRDAPSMRREPARETAPPSRLSYNDQRELEAGPALIERLEAEKAGLERQLADPAGFANDRDAFNAALARHRQLAASLAAAEERWLELAARAEALKQARPKS